MSTVGVDMRSTEIIELQVARQLSRESALCSKDHSNETAIRIEDGIERDGAIADHISPLNRRGSDSIKDHDNDVLIIKGNILFKKPFYDICMI